MKPRPKSHTFLLMPFCLRDYFSFFWGIILYARAHSLSTSISSLSLSLFLPLCESMMKFIIECVQFQCTYTCSLHGTSSSPPRFILYFRDHPSIPSHPILSRRTRPTDYGRLFLLLSRHQLPTFVSDVLMYDGFEINK
jgi:hypothetical protein